MKKQFLLLTSPFYSFWGHVPLSLREHSFIKVKADGQLVRDGKPYYFVGTNF